MCNSQTHTHAGTHKKRMGSHARIRTHDNEENKTNRHIRPTNKIKCVKAEINTNTHLQRNKHRQSKQIDIYPNCKISREPVQTNTHLQRNKTQKRKNKLVYISCEIPVIMKKVFP